MAVCTSWPPLLTPAYRCIQPSNACTHTQPRNQPLPTCSGHTPRHTHSLAPPTCDRLAAAAASLARAPASPAAAPPGFEPLLPLPAPPPPSTAAAAATAAEGACTGRSPRECRMRTMVRTASASNSARSSPALAAWSERMARNSRARDASSATYGSAGWGRGGSRVSLHAYMFVCVCVCQGVCVCVRMCGSLFV